MAEANDMFSALIAGSGAGQAIRDNNAEEKQAKDGPATESTISASKKSEKNKGGRPRVPKADQLAKKRISEKKYRNRVNLKRLVQLDPAKKPPRMCRVI